MDPRKSHGETRRQLSSQTCITPSPIKHTNVIPTNIDQIPSNTTHSGPSAVLYVFEDNEAVIKMIVPRIRHVARTHRVALDWLFVRINLDPKKNQIRYIDTKNQLADMLAKGNFTRDEWEQSSSYVSTSHFSSICCTKNFSLISCSTMAKRIQDQKEEERVVSKSRPAAMNLFLSRQVLPPHRVRLHLKVRGCRLLRWAPTAGCVLIQGHSTQRRLLKCD